jgi:hypothetical protein
MNVIVETNFIIELALEQAEAEQGESIVEWAEEERISLAIPAFAQACKGNSEDSAL